MRTYATESFGGELADPLIAAGGGSRQDPEDALDYEVGDEPVHPSGSTAALDDKG